VKNGGIFVEIATATSSIYSRYIRTLEAEADWQPMCFLPNVMVHKCKPGDILVLVMSQPSSFTILPEHLVSQTPSTYFFRLKKYFTIY
jgi:hypothetical protein